MMNPDGTPNPEALEQMLDNPMFTSAMEQMSSNPAMMQQMLDNPMMQQMTRNNPQMAAMMNNPEMMRTMMNPQMLRAAINMRRQMGGGMGGGMEGMGGGFGGMGMPAAPAWNGVGVPPAAPPPTPHATPQNATISDLDFSNLLNSFNPSASSTHPAPPSNQTPSERYARQLQSLNDMGFGDKAANLVALQATNGNVNRAVERLLGGS